MVAIFSAHTFRPELKEAILREWGQLGLGCDIHVSQDKDNSNVFHFYDIFDEYQLTGIIDKNGEMKFE